MTSYAISIKGLDKTYINGFQALKDIHLDIKKGEIFALLGPNGAGKTTLIGCVCGTIRPTGGEIKIFGFDYISHYREARSKIGLVPQELYTDAFETVRNTVAFSRELFGKAPNPEYLKDILQRLSLWDKKDDQIRTLSGGMKRRVMIAKALAHEPQILFLDEPSAGVDVELRKSMWEQVESLRQLGMTILLTTHYIEEAEKMADRVGIINGGELILTETKDELMKSMSNKQVIVDLEKSMKKLPDNLLPHESKISLNGSSITLNYDVASSTFDVFNLLDALKENGIGFKDLSIRQRSLEEIFVELVEKK